ncbi:hypothetical protein EFO73_12395 [Lacticaseibacillus rhamnosus]|nr:hypothetical protein [Lacticaseibacillus rhamnosus]
MALDVMTRFWSLRPRSLCAGFWAGERVIESEREPAPINLSRTIHKQKSDFSLLSRFLYTLCYTSMDCGESKDEDVFITFRPKSSARKEVSFWSNSLNKSSFGDGFKALVFAGPRR